jgi:hypothetical protein
VDPTSVHYLGHSLGAIIGGVYLAAATSGELRTGTLAMPGGGIAQLLVDSPTFGPQIIAGLGAQGLQPGTTLFQQFFRDAQTAVDAGDPLNFIATAARNHPIHVIQVVGGGSSPPDQVVPNSATQRLIDAAALTRIPAPTVPGPIFSTTGTPPGHRAYVNLVVGNHGSIIDPTVNPAATVEMQTEAVSFALSQGTAIQVAVPAVIQP